MIDLSFGLAFQQALASHISFFRPSRLTLLHRSRDLTHSPLFLFSEISATLHRLLQYFPQPVSRIYDLADVPRTRDLVQNAVHVSMHRPGGIGVTRSLRLGTPDSTASRLDPLFWMYLELDMVMFLGGCCRNLRKYMMYSTQRTTQLWIIEPTRYDYFVGMRI